MNYNVIISRGSKYVDFSLRNWSIRKEKMITLWGKIFKLENTVDNRLLKIRIDKIAIELEERIKLLIQAEYLVKERKIKEDFEQSQRIIFLECPRFECRYGPNAYGTGIEYRHYEPGKFKCKKCGSELRLQGQRETDDMLFELRIETH